MSAIDNSVLRPLRLGEILDRAVRLYRRHFLQLLAIIALVQIPITALQLAGGLLVGDALTNFPLFDPTAPGNPFIFDDLFGPRQVFGSSLNSLSSMLSFFLVNGIATVVLTKVLAISYLGKNENSISEAYRQAREDFFPIIVALIVYVLLSIFLMIWWLLIPCVGWLTGGGMLIFTASIILPLLAPVIVLEKQPAANAWRRAWDLGRRRFWWLIGFSLLLGLFTFLVVGAPAAIISGVSAFFLTDPLSPIDSLAFTIQIIAQSLITLFSVLLLLPLRTACYTVVYYDLRVRHEGLDLSLQMVDQLAERPAHQEQTLPAEEPLGWLEKLRLTAPNAGKGPLITWEELGQFALITVGIIALFVLLYISLFGLVLLLIGPSLAPF